MTFYTKSGRPTYWPPSDPQMTDCCHAAGEWCARYTWADALEHALERARLARVRQYVRRNRAYEDGPDDQWWSISAYLKGGRRK